MLLLRHESRSGLYELWVPSSKTHKVLLTVNTSICSSVSTQFIFHLNISLYPTLSCPHLLDNFGPSQELFLPPGKSNIPFIWSVFLPARGFKFTLPFLVIKDHFLIRLPSCIQQSNLFCSELPEKEMCHLSMASTPFLLHTITPAACVISLFSTRHSLFFYLLATLSVHFLWGFTSLSPADPSQWIFEALLIAGTSLYVQQAKESHTKHAWLNIV